MFNAGALMTYCEAFFLKNLQSLIQGNDTFRKQLLGSKHTQLIHGLLMTLSNKMEEMLRRRNNTPRTASLSPAQMLNPKLNCSSRSYSDISHPFTLGVPGIQKSHSFDSACPSSIHSDKTGSSPFNQTRSNNHLLLTSGDLPKRPNIPQPPLPHSVPPMVPPPRWL